LDAFGDYQLTQHQFAQFIGKAKLYQYISREERQQIPNLSLNDSQISAVVKAYIDDNNFNCDKNGSIDLWKFYNLLTGAIKSSYIDNYFDKSINSLTLTQGLVHALNSESRFKWFIC
jgi:hypothetical protein